MIDNLLRDEDLIPIGEVAPLIRRSYSSALRLAKQGRLAHRRDAAGRYWSTPAAAAAFLGEPAGGDAERGNWTRRMREVLR